MREIVTFDAYATLISFDLLWRMRRRARISSRLGLGKGVCAHQIVLPSVVCRVPHPWVSWATSSRPRPPSSKARPAQV